MTDRQRQAVMMRLEGKSYQEIGDALGTTRQNAHLLALGALRDAPKAGATNWRYYENLATHIAENYRSLMDFATKSGVGYQTIANMLKNGKTPAWRTISKLTEVTGLTVEELMAKDVHSDAK